MSIESSTTTGSSPPKDSFLNYFFGGAAKGERPVLAPADKMHTHHHSPIPSLSADIEQELEPHFNQASFLRLCR